MSPEALEAERIARAFDLTYLSSEGYERLALLLAFVRAELGPCPPRIIDGVVWPGDLVSAG